MLSYISLLLSLLIGCNSFVVPAPAGFDVASSAVAMDDLKRLDPFSPDNSTRRLMVSSFYPVSDCEVYTAPYMPPIVANATDAMYSAFVPPGTFGSIQMRFCRPKVSIRLDQRRIILFSPGLGVSRMEYSILAQNLASLGWNVVTVDHPYDAPVVVFPDGSVIEAGNISDLTQELLDISTRVTDLEFLSVQLRHNVTLLDALFSNATWEHEPVHQMYGHSMGGNTAASLLLKLGCIATGVNLDGQIQGPVEASGIDAPFMLFGAEAHNFTADPSWEPFYNASKGPKLQLSLHGGVHGTFTDLPRLAQLAQINVTGLASVIGSIPGDEAIGSLTTVLSAWFEYGLGEHEKVKDVLEGGVNGVSVVRSDIALSCV